MSWGMARQELPPQGRTELASSAATAGTAGTLREGKRDPGNPQERDLRCFQGSPASRGRIRFIGAVPERCLFNLL